MTAGTASGGRRLRLRRRRGPRGPEATSLVGHLTELRNRLLKALLAVALGTVVGFLCYDRGC